MSIFDNTNNGGNLTVAYDGSHGGQPYGNPSSILYPGQTGGYTSPNGYTYATFNSVQDGFNALVGYVQRSLPNFSSPSAFTQHYLGTSTPNAANANPSGYAASISAAVTSGNPVSIAKAIFGAEGNGAAVAGVTGPQANTQPSTLWQQAQGALDNALVGFEAVNHYGIGAAGVLIPGVISDKNQATMAGVAGKAATQDKNIFSGTVQRIALIVLGVILVGGALLLLAIGSKTVQGAVKTAAVAA